MTTRSTTRRRFPAIARLVATLALLAHIHLAGFPAHAQAAALETSNWPTLQPLGLPSPGLHKISLPATTLGVARPDLADLRVIHPRGGEVPYALEFLRPIEVPHGSPRSMEVSLQPGATVVLLEPGGPGEIEALTLRTPATDFIKAVQIEGSADRRTWTTLARGMPVFRQGGASRLSLNIEPRSWPWLRLTLDDRTSPPIGITGLSIRARSLPAPTTPSPVTITARSEIEHHTRLALRLPARHLRVASLVLDTPEPFFMREVTVLGRVVSESVTQEVALARGTIHRLAVDGQTPSVELSVAVETQSVADEWIIDIANHDNPPLAIPSASLQLRPIHLLLRADEPGTYSLLTGHPTCPPPRYDVADLLRAGVTTLPESNLLPGSPVANPGYRASPTLPGVSDRGAALDITRWHHRRPVRIAATGVQQLDLDLQVLSLARADLSDLRLLRDGDQIPYLLQTAPSPRVLPVVADLADNPKHPHISRWRLRLPYARLPLTRLSCSSPTALFQRTVTLTEEFRDERGSVGVATLAVATWTSTPNAPARSLVLDFHGRPSTDTLFLETDNGDNPSIQLERFEFTSPVPRLLFKLGAVTDDLWLFYGHPQSPAPSYDLRLVADELRTAARANATLGAAEIVTRDPWAERLKNFGTSGPLFWVVLVTVAGTLLWLVLRFLPKPAP